MEPFKLAQFRVDPARNRIADGDAVHQVEPKVMAVLLCLCRYQGAVVSKETLFAEVWPDTAIGNEVLTRAISELRRMLADDAKKPRFIETIFKKGYRLMRPPEPILPAINAIRGSVVKDALSKPEKQPIKHRNPWLWIAVAFVFMGMATFWLLQKRQANFDGRIIAELSRPMPITTLAGHEYRSPVSPDGHRIAFVWEGDDGRDEYDIYLKTIDEEGAVQFTETAGGEDFPAWSPDGKYLAYCRKTADGSGLYLKPVIGGEERLLLSIPGCFHGLDWSPDGTKLAYGAHSSIDQPKQIFSMAIDDLQPVALTHPVPGCNGDELPAWQEQGLGLAFVRVWNHGGEEDLFYLPLNELGRPIDSPKRMTFDRQPISGISWLPRGRGIVMISSRDGYSRMWQVSMPSGDVVQLPIASYFMMDPYVHPDGSMVTYTEKVVEQNIWAKTLDSDTEDEGERIIFSTYMDLSPVFSPDGTRLAWLSYRSGHMEVWMSGVDGRNPQQVSRFQGARISSPKWSPDGQHLIVTQTRLGNSDICRVSMVGGLVENLTDDPAREENGFFSPDGQWLYFASNRNGSWQLWRKHMASQALEQVTQQGGFSGSLRANGDLVFTKFGVQGIWLQDGVDGSESPLVERFPHRYHGHWLLWRDDLLYLQWNGEDYQLLRKRLDGGDPQEVTRIKRLGWEQQSFTISPDGSRLVYGQCDRLESDIMKVELKEWDE